MLGIATSESSALRAELDRRDQREDADHEGFVSIAAAVASVDCSSPETRRQSMEQLLKVARLRTNQHTERALVE